MTDGTRRIGILLFNGVEELDFAGPWEVLAFWTKMCPEDGWEVFTFSRHGESVECAKGLKVIPDYALDDAPPMDAVVFPGGKGTRWMLRDDAVLACVRRFRDKIPLITSVCTGSLVLAAAGLLHGRPATTHWLSLDVLAQLDPTIDVRRDERFVDDGDIITAAGVSAGIDMALYLVQRLAGKDRAQWVRRGIQYDPEPPTGTDWPEGAEWEIGSVDPTAESRADTGQLARLVR
ncbi:DJ-1/PfpI family protein [Nocardia otitidiscaviarum]|uniref:DJ-1/PfpI family protein n=1 Tax=Nocardia otitidiscaviarum TaxID=1823 RepID=UPI001893C08D|nr:DJ-1/PfpI family protein [Nocardia otitidiscaviarum]MBF6238796.1 DJ-1/PfpI family protein [Nocardia otitidiscaviarum]